LEIPWIDNTAVPLAVLMLNLSFKKVSDCLYTPVRVPGKAGDIFLYFVGPKVIKEKERIRQLMPAATKYSL
jgi:hypothetical protein